MNLDRLTPEAVDNFARSILDAIRAAPADGMANLYIDAPPDLSNVVIDVRVNMRMVARILLGGVALSHGATDSDLMHILGRDH